MLCFFDEVEGCVLHPIQRADAESIFEALHFSSSGPICYSSLVGLGSDDTNVMLGTPKFSSYKVKLDIVSFHCNCHLAALIANHVSLVLPDFLGDVTIQIWYFFKKAKKGIECFCTIEATESWSNQVSQLRDMRQSLT